VGVRALVGGKDVLQKALAEKEDIAA